MTIKYFKAQYLILAAVLLVASCVTQKYQQPGVAVQGQLFRDTTASNNGESDSANVGDTITFADLSYTQLFTDTVLQNLIAEGLRENLSLKTAVQRINEAYAGLRQARAAFFPSLDGGASATHSKQSLAALNLPPDFVGTFPLAITTYQLSLSTSWEADVWGKLRSAKKAAFASWLQSDAAKRAVQTQLIANIANYYYQLLSLDQQLRITEQTLKNRKDDVESMKLLKENAVVTGAAVVQSEANRYAAEVLIPDIKKNIRETENALSTLLARVPGPIRRNSLSEQIPHQDLQTGVSSLLLRNRPDVQQAELAFRVAFENTNVARTYFYPQLTLTAQGGLSSIKIQDLFTASVFYNIVAGLAQPIFNKGQNKARLAVAKAQQQEAFYNYQQSLLNAGEEVSNALYAYQTAVEKQASRTYQVSALEKAVDYTRQLMEYSSATNYTDVLTSEQSLLLAQLNSVNDKLQQLQAVVDLYRALGGGWK